MLRFENRQKYRACMAQYPMGPPPDQDWHDWYNNVYLKSEHWRRFSYAFRSSRGWICEECGRCYSKRGQRHKLHTDHKHYRSLGNETYIDVRARCVHCHTKGITSDWTVKRNRQVARELELAKAAVIATWKGFRWVVPRLWGLTCWIVPKLLLFLKWTLIVSFILLLSPIGIIYLALILVRFGPKMLTKGIKKGFWAILLTFFDKITSRVT